MRENLILGVIYGEHSCGITLMWRDKILLSLEEEKLVRVKSYEDLHNNMVRYPYESFKALKDTYNINLEDVAYFTSFYDYKDIKYVVEILTGFVIPEEKFIWIDHHDAHCSLAYYTSNMTNKSVLVASIDASGGEYSAKFFYGDKDGNMNSLGGINITQKSLGHYYIALTELLGFKRLKDEGKIVGMAAHGAFDQDFYNIFNNSIIIKNGQTDDGGMDGVYIDMYRNFFNVIGSRYWKNNNTLKNIAYNGQLVFEEKVVDLLLYYFQQIKDNFSYYGETINIALSGGVFANVKLNQKINDLPWVSEVYVSPPMGDEGLTLGCCLGTLKKIQPELKPGLISNVFLGMEYPDKFNNSVFYTHTNITTIVDLLEQQHILGLYQGKIEYGPRALGNRSILADPRSTDMYNKLNSRLQRNDFMPFAPIVLDEDADVIFNVRKSRYTAEFMTMCYDTRSEWIDKIPTVVHPADKTARIQIVTELNNRFLYQILKEFKRRTGIGCLVNTSFNIHGEPIVNKPEEAEIHLLNGVVDFIITKKIIFKKGI